MGNDCIEIEGLVVFANHGVFQEEKRMGQKFEVSLKLYMDMNRAAANDDITLAVNYGDVCAFVTEFTKKNRCKLIEAAARNIADALLVRYSQINIAEVTLKKPWAPIGLPLESVAVRMTQKRSTAYIGIGSNMGDRQAYLDFAVNAISENERCRIKAVSEYIETEPWGVKEQASFLNGCIKLETLLDPHELLAFLQSIENEAGRERKVHWGPRTLDLDILLYDDLIIQTDELTIPHPYMHKREFVLKPLCEIAPYAYNPIVKEYVVNLLGMLCERN